MKKHPTVECPTCNTSVKWSPENTYKPFCCERCKLIDLGEWANESRTISGPATITESAFRDNEF